MFTPNRLHKSVIPGTHGITWLGETYLLTFITECAISFSDSIAYSEDPLIASTPSDVAVKKGCWVSNYADNVKMQHLPRFGSTHRALEHGSMRSSWEYEKKSDFIIYCSLAIGIKLLAHDKRSVSQHNNTRNG